MQYPIDSAPWRRNFVATLQLLARAAVRQPLGPPDPVLCGAAAVRLYTGDLWSAGCLEVFAAVPRTLITELFAAGFRWTGRPKLADRGLWHPELQIGIDVIDHVQRGLVQPTNTLSVALDLGATGPADRELVSLKVVGIEDLIVAEVAGMQRQGPSEEAAARARVLAELGRNGVGGRLRSGYLHRRLAWETRGEIVFEDQWPDGAGEDDAASRMTALSRMRTLIHAWRVRHGFSFDRPRLGPPERRFDTKKRRPTGNGVTTNGGGQGSRVWQRPASSRWMLCNRHFPSKPRRTNGIAGPMNVTFLSIKLEARSAVHRCFRAYQMDVGADLFGAWLVEMSYGRIGRRGRSKIRSFTTIEGAEAQVDACLRKSATAPRRIGVAYRSRGHVRCEQWRQPDLADRLDARFPAAGAVSS